ncbi:hypothetical protein ADUPG1_014063, partial [Aduncisulcus paluster]
MTPFTIGLPSKDPHSGIRMEK